MGASKSTEIQLFSGGVNLVPAPHLLAPTDSRALSGVNIRKGNLSPFLGPLFIENATGDYAYYFKDMFRYYDLYRSNVLFNRVWYWTSALGSGKMYSDGTELPLGIDQPTTTPIVQSQSATKGITGIMTYVYTYYDPKSGSESPPSKPSNTIELLGVDANKAVEVSNLEPSPDGFETRLYRIGGLQTMYTAVDTLPSTATDYIDSLSFTEMQGLVLDTIRSFPPPTGLQHLTLHQNRFFGAVNAELYFTPAGKPDSWYMLDFLAFEDVITGLVSVSNGLLVMSDHKTWLVTGLMPQQFAIHLLSDSEGCISTQSIAVQEGSAIWLSASGFLMSNGSKIVNISLFKIGRTEAIEPFGAVYVDKRYLLSFGGSMYPSDDLYPNEDLYPGNIQVEGYSLPKGAIVIDFSNGTPAFSTITDVVMGYLVEAENEVYQIEATGVVSSRIITNTGAAIITENGLSNIVAVTSSDGVLAKTFRGKGLREIKYLSPVYTEGAIGVLKQYEKLRIVYQGVGTIKIYDENRKLFVEKVISSTKRVSEWVYIPVAFNRGYGIQFEVLGTMVVDSLQWIWTVKEAQ